jgi:hypothetical protein
MGKPKNVVPMTLSLPKDLKAKMDVVTVPVNWSAVAAKAFEAKLLELESAKETTTMDDVIARMKAAEELDNKEEYQRGWAAGQNWVKDVAHPKELRALDHCGWAFVVNEDDDDHILPHRYYVEFHPECEDDLHASEAFWESVLGKRCPEGAILAGFFEGALDIWRKVKDKL